LNIPVYHESRVFEFNGKKLLVGHGDGLGPGDHGYKTIKKVFRNPLSKFLFGLIPPFFWHITGYLFQQEQQGFHWGE